MKTSNPPEENDIRFNKSLQLHHAADSFQTSFLNSNQKQVVMKNTKQYVRNALVTLVDHLGSVSANLDRHLSKAASIYQTQLKIDLLNQKLLTCQDYSHKIALAKVSSSSSRGGDLKHNSRYIKPSISNESFSMNDNDEFKVDEEVPLFLYTCDTCKSSSTSVPVVAVRDNLAVQPKPQSFQFQDKGKSRRGLLFIKSRPNNQILSVGGSRRIC